VENQSSNNSKIDNNSKTHSLAANAKGSSLLSAAPRPVRCAKRGA
jgi:hypothetical protein